ncbi:glycosyltransferase [Variovorax sp. J22P240]|uniref:glycosyltransferase n=1 Tax=Variovorax sp. J22P240 TaxID=3053514 RepID=UPI002574FB52|nr:glycosyltransferase [Variovorax sp. J22P240]MDL9998092.1 glycosyltransferase [Variovorax sp. J22P240]
MRTSLILTCFNEHESIGALFDDVLNQSILPNEVVIVDAGSNDGTLDVLNLLSAKFVARDVGFEVLVHDGIGIAAGRNTAIERASGDVIAVTDAGCRLERDWLLNITRPLVEDRADFVGGFFLPVAHTRFQRVLACLTTSSKPVKGFMPSSRSVAFRKAVWRAAGKYPEWLRWGEDTLFNSQCLATGPRYEVAADAVVHWEVRRTWSQVAKQFARYAYGDGLARRTTLSLGLGPVVYLGAIVGVALGHLSAAMLVPLFGVSWLARRRSVQIRDWPYAVFLGMTIQSSRVVGYCTGLTKSFWVRME